MRALPALAVAAAALAGCGDQPLPPPRILSIEPSQMSSSGTANVVVTVDAILPFEVDYGSGQVMVERSLVLGIGTLLVGNSRYENQGMLTGFVPSRLHPGIYDVSLTLVDLRVAILERGFTVNPGLWPGGYSIDTIPNQQRDVPFAVTIRAAGGNASIFEGTVDLSASSMSMPRTISPMRTGPFTAGVRVENVVITDPGPATITVTDLLGTAFTSNPFIVN